MQLVAKYPCREDMLHPHVGKMVTVITTSNETIQGRLEHVTSSEITITKTTVAVTAAKKQKARTKRFHFPGHGPGFFPGPYPGPGFRPPFVGPRPFYPPYPVPVPIPTPYPYGAPYYPRYGAESLILPLALLSALYV